MQNYKDIPIRNVFYMVAYILEFLDDKFFNKSSSEVFANHLDLLALLLERGIARQLKQGLYKEYKTYNDCIPTLRGKVDMPQMIKDSYSKEANIPCEFDELTTDNHLNRILKTTAMLLVKDSNIDSNVRKNLKKQMLFFSDIQTLNPKSISWRSLRFTQNNKSYRILISICQLIIEGCLSNTEDGDTLSSNINDEQMHKLYELFVLRYFQKHHKSLHPGAPSIKWALDDESNSTYLPSMKSDIVLKNTTDMLIIDTKFYQRTLQVQKKYGSETVHSGNLYQIFTYVKNSAALEPKLNVSGILLYAQTQSANQPCESYQMDGNTIHVRTLDLSLPFEDIVIQLDNIASLLNG